MSVTFYIFNCVNFDTKNKTKHSLILPELSSYQDSREENVCNQVTRVTKLNA